ncbi:HemK2/MTQ2 family protein methyltransferase [Streptomyces sp. NPDC059371]|uniref:HemK2/MTQ2 family protein methyltransferase n=1 Tax=Streptomyces sp. NPDC059371 TaxID=3346812 RepID=UPI003680431F
MPSTAVKRRALLSRLLALPGVYRPQADTELLGDELGREDLGVTTEVLEIGTGTGAVALSAAARGARVTAVDVSRRAVFTARLNALRHGLPLRVLHGDFMACTQGRRFDVVVTNPPYVPSPSARVPSSGPERAWDAGPDGRAVIDRICESAPFILRPGGVLLMVHSVMCDPERTLKRLAQAGLPAQVTAKASVPWGPVLHSRRPWLQKQGFSEAGEEREGLVVIRAQAI